MATRVPDERILDAVVRTVLAHGYAGATTREIAAAAGINEVTLFRRFGDKQALVHAAVAAQVARFDRHGPAYTGGLRADLLRVIAFYEEVFRDRGRLLIMLLAELPRRPDLVDAVGRPLVVIEELLEMLGRYQRAGRLVDGPPLDVLVGLLGPLLMQSVAEQIRRSVGDHQSPKPPTAEAFLDRFLAGYSGPGGAGDPAPSSPVDGTSWPDARPVAASSVVTRGGSGRRTGTGGSRADITAAARRLFAARGYDGVSMRAIAAEAGVDAALIHHFFGTKRTLFDALVDLPFDPEQAVEALLAPGVEGLGERIVRFVLGVMRGPETGEALAAVLRTAAAQPDAAAMLRETYSRRLLEPLAIALDADRPLLRAALCSTQLMGLLMAEHVVGLAPIVGADTEDLVVICGAILQRNLTGPLPSR